jgi:hypothetical protein
VGPGEQNIQHELRRQAAQIAIPSDMWEKISEGLDADRVRNQRQQQLKMRRAQWKPALALVAAAGMLWLTVAPAGFGPQPQAAIDGAPSPVAVSSVPNHDTLPLRFYRQAAYDIDRTQPEEQPSDGVGSQTPRSRAIAAR